MGDRMNHFCHLAFMKSLLVPSYRSHFLSWQWAILRISIISMISCLPGILFSCSHSFYLCSHKNNSFKKASLQVTYQKSLPPRSFHDNSLKFHLPNPDGPSLETWGQSPRGPISSTASLDSQTLLDSVLIGLEDQLDFMWQKNTEWGQWQGGTPSFPPHMEMWVPEIKGQRVVSDTQNCLFHLLTLGGTEFK